MKRGIATLFILFLLAGTTYAQRGTIDGNPPELSDSIDVNTSGAIQNDILSYDGSTWIPSDDLIVNSITYGDTYWDDLRVGLGGVQVGVSAPSWTDYKGGQVLAFGGGPADDNKVTFITQMPHGYKIATDVKPHIHWTLEDNTSCDVHWVFTHSCAPIGSAFPAETTLIVNAASPGVTDEHEVSGMGTISGTALTGPSFVTIGSLTRDATDAADTCDGKDAYLLEIDYHYEIDTPGTRDELDK
jgi:hypothetical protein